ncbi:MAG: hypothetical protein OEZ58_24375, partial [Gammaproteobacteria bacterium]|nr:hypothetical protein [Gammaproteobacteria bacterium]
MNKLFQSTLVTDLGEVACSLFSESNRCEIEENQASIIVKTSGHICELIELEIDNKWIPKDMSIEQSKGWLWKIRKSKPKPEKLGIECKMNPGCKVTSERAAGEYLDCIAIESKEKEVLIGTEDPEALLHRSERSDYMPSRFSKVPDNFNGIVFVNYIQFGFEALLPVLYEEE